MNPPDNTTGNAAVQRRQQMLALTAGDVLAYRTPDSRRLPATETVVAVGVDSDGDPIILTVNRAGQRTVRTCDPVSMDSLDPRPLHRTADAEPLPAPGLTRQR